MKISQLSIQINLSKNPTKTQKYQYQKMINFSQLFTCKNTQIFQKLKLQRKYIDTQTLSVLIESQGDLLFMMGPVCYGITKETRAEYYVYENNNEQFMILQLENNLHGNYELLVKENQELLIACLVEKCQVVAKEKDVKKEKILTPTGPVEPKKTDEIAKQQQKEQEVQIGLPSSQNDDRLVSMSKSLGQGMYMIGKYLSKGISTVGGYVANNIEPSKQIKFSQSTKQNLKQANEFTTKVFGFAAGSVKKLIGYGRQVALDAAEQKNPAGNVVQQKSVTDIKSGVVTGVKVFINLYDGFVEAGDEVKNGAFQAGGQIVRKKYGIEAQQALNHVVGGVNNAIKIYKLPKDSVKYIFKVEKQQKN